MPNPSTLGRRMLLFSAILGSAVVILFGIALTVDLPRSGPAGDLDATAAALDLRATEISIAATRLVEPGVGFAPSTNGTGPLATPRTFVAQPEGGRENPIPPGDEVVAVDGLRIRISAVDFDAWDRVQAANQFNDPPAEDERMVLVRVEAHNLRWESDEPRWVDDSDFRVVGEKGVVYEPFASASRCGVIPDELDFEIFEGATVEGNICVRLPKDEEDLLLIYRPDSSWDRGVVYFRLQD